MEAKEDVNLETQRKHTALKKYKAAKKDGSHIANHEDLLNCLTNDRDFFSKENSDLKEKLEKQKELIKNFYNMQKQQYDRINELENEIQDCLEEFGNFELSEEVLDLVETSKERARELKDAIDRQDNIK